ncbi:MAG: sulfatase [Planctomycetota bacterium]|nr:sulfatase [Planctomycetota bacterium]
MIDRFPSLSRGSRLLNAIFRKPAVALACLVGLPLPLAVAKVSPGADDRPNIVIIYSDDHAQHAVSAYGSRINRTPAIDQLARDGMRFNNSFVANAICGPARATLLTGLHSHANGMTANNTRFRDELPTFAKCLQATGYRTAMIGKWHIPTRPNGFDYWAIKRGGYYNSEFETREGKEPSEGHVTDVITDRSVAWMRENAQADRPFLIWISHSAVHRTWAPAGRHLDRYTDRDIPQPANLHDDYRGRNPGASTAQMRVSRDLFPAYDLKLPVAGDQVLDRAAERQLEQMTPEQRARWNRAFAPRNQAYAEAGLNGRQRTEWNYQRYIKNYLRCVDGIDEGVATVRDFLTKNGLADNTIVIYTSDQGFFLGDHGWYDKRWMYEESLRTPLLIHWPGVTKPDSTADQLVQNIDIAPTLLAMAGVEPEPGMQGESLAPILRGEQTADWRQGVYYHYQMTEPDGRTSHLVAKHYGIRTARYKLIYFYDHDYWELYDLAEDPGEMNNLYPDLASSSLVKQLKTELADLRIQYADETGKSW